MESVLTSDIFFFITSVAVAVVTTLIASLLVYIIKIVRDIRYIIRKIKDGSDAVSQDLHEIRMKLKNKNLFSPLLMTALHAFANRFEERTSTKKRRRTKKD